MKLLRAALAVLLLVALGSRARADDIPAGKRALILLRILAYDRNLPARVGDTVRIAVVYRAGDTVSEHAGAELVVAIATAARSVAGKPVRALSLPFAPDTLESDLQSEGVVALYVCPGLSTEVPLIAAAAQRRAVLSFGPEAQMVQDGLSIGLVRRGERAAIFVNLVAARAAGSDLSSELLRLADWVNR